MRIFLASLICLLLCTSQSWALKGGPPYPQGSNIVGTYAGVLQGVFDPTNPASSNSIGLFSLSVPTTGNASGVFVMFSRGRVFTGTAQAFADPRRSTLRGILSASYAYSLSFVDSAGILQTIPVTATANGPVSANISTATSGIFGTSSTTIVRGDATLSISQGQVAANGDPVITSVLSLVVSGVKQSNTASVAPVVTTGG